MSALASRLARDERGQSFVFFLVVLPTLLLVVALVVNIGFWLQASRQAQTVADAAALGIAQDIPSGNAQALADNLANQNWSNFSSSGGIVTVGAGAGAQSVSVHVSHPMPTFFGSLLGSVFNVTVHADASAGWQVPAALSSLVPLGVKCDPNTGCPTSFTWLSTGVNNSTVIPVRFSSVNTTTFAGFMSCDALNPTGSNCLQRTNGTGSYRVLNVNLATLASVLTSVEGTAHLVPVYDSLTGNGGNRRVDVIGWAALTIDNVNSGSNSIQITGHFDKFFADSSLVSSGGSSTPLPDFGVRAVALTG